MLSLITNAFVHHTNGKHLPEVTKPNLLIDPVIERVAFITFRNDRVAAVLYLGAHTEEQSVRSINSTGKRENVVFMNAHGLTSFFLSQVLSHRRIYVFGELLEQPSVQSVRILTFRIAFINLTTRPVPQLKDSEFSNAFNSLELFAYGTLADYQSKHKR
jgi:hypothetical protein